jgi:hypothetical protein
MAREARTDHDSEANNKRSRVEPHLRPVPPEPQWVEEGASFLPGWLRRRLRNARA